MTQKQSNPKARLLAAIIAAVPYPQQILNIDAWDDEDAIRFDWRGTRYRVSTQGSVEESDGRFLRGSSAAILMEALIRDRLSMAI